MTLESPQDGSPLARALKQVGVPSLFLTAQPEAARANADAALGVIEKPYTPEDVSQSLQVIAAILAGEPSTKAGAGVLGLFAR